MASPQAVSAPAGGAVAAVEFAGERGGVAPLAWGQRSIWLAICRTMPDDHYFNFGRVVPLPAHPAQDVLAALAALVARHESLRTRLRAVDGDVCQEVARSGTLAVEIVAAARADAGRVAREMMDRLAGPAFDYHAEWPLRAGLVTCEGQVRYAVLVFCHLAADGLGADVAVRDLRALLRRGSAGDPVPRQPLDLAAEQAGPAGRRLSAAAIAYWEREYRRVPPTMFQAPAGPPREPRFWRAAMVSPALDTAVEVLSGRYRVSGTTVLLAGAAAMVGQAAAQRTCVMLPVVNNRFHVRDRDLVTPLAQDGLFVLDLGAETFEELLRAAWAASLRAYKHTRFDPLELRRAIEAIGAERGVEVHPYCCFNDQRLVERPRIAKVEHDPAATRAAVERTRITWPVRIDRLNCRFCLHVTDEPDGLGVSLTADTAFLPPAAMEGYLRGLERLLVEAACRGVVLADLPALTAG
ncbi:condensation domain-containing protein [Sphaerisporangium rufum]|uniref:condensation domain-containing protein n=1 Tax=Sphaerisporangium rufum TaxID=1381558 RepID=UPI0019507303|nr:condensation domain-containing protein [Sphaerisporangium rufum]